VRSVEVCAHDSWGKTEIDRGTTEIDRGKAEIDLMKAEIDRESEENVVFVLEFDRVCVE